MVLKIPFTGRLLLLTAQLVRRPHESGDTAACLDAYRDLYIKRSGLTGGQLHDLRSEVRKAMRTILAEEA